jgi:hypothetical protein
MSKTNATTNNYSNISNNLNNTDNLKTNNNYDKQIGGGVMKEKSQIPLHSDESHKNHFLNTLRAAREGNHVNVRPRLESVSETNGRENNGRENKVSGPDVSHLHEEIKILKEENLRLNKLSKNEIQENLELTKLLKNENQDTHLHEEIKILKEENFRLTKLSKNGNQDIDQMRDMKRYKYTYIYIYVCINE